MNRKTHFITPAELIIIVLLLAASVSAKLIIGHSDGSGTAVIDCGDVHEELPLSENGSYTFEGVSAVFEIKDGRIRVTGAECRDKICEKTGYIGRAGESIICVPAKLTVHIENGSSSEADAEVG